MSHRRPALICCLSQVELNWSVKDGANYVLGQIKKASNLFGPQVIGEDGEAAVIAFDHRIREMQSFTNDPQKITDAIKKINAGSNSARMIDSPRLMSAKAVSLSARRLSGTSPRRRSLVAWRVGRLAPAHPPNWSRSTIEPVW